MKLADNKATLSFSNGTPSMELPIYSGTVGPDVVDIRKLYGLTGMFTRGQQLCLAMIAAGLTILVISAVKKARAKNANA